MKSLLRVIKSTHAHLLDILLPQKCLGCLKDNFILCSNCIKSIKKSTITANPDIYACFDYQDPLVKKIIWNLKYYNRFTLGKILGKELYIHLYKEIHQIQAENQNLPIYVVPVPLSKKKQRIRGYNQAKMIAEGFCSSQKECFVLKNNLVIKTIETIPQARMHNKNRRLKNIHGAFQIKDSQIIKGKTIIIIDDVTTTGGTIEEIMKLLKKSGAKKVVGFAVAH